MRTLVIVLALTALPLAAAAEGPPSTDIATANLPDNTLVDSGHALLQLSPMYLEIKEVIELSDAKETELLTQLAAAKTDEEVHALIVHIENLAVDRELDLLRIQARHARLDNKFELERQLKSRMLDVLEACGR